MNFNTQVNDLENRVDQLKASVAAAAQETHEQLKRPESVAAQAWTDRALAEAKQEASTTAETRRSHRGSKRDSDAKARLDELKAKAQRRSDQVDADFAESDADWAEADAYAAIDYADWAVENARVAILNAIDARISADEKAAALV